MKLHRITVQWLLRLLILALLLVQLIGVVHGVVHGVHGVHGTGPGSAHGPHAHEAHDPTHQHAGHLEPDEADELAALFSAHQEDQEGCRLFDQACHSLPLSTLPTLSLPLALCSQVRDISRSRALARWVALFQARGPPLFR